jgi:hypothetical protein
MGLANLITAMVAPRRSGWEVSWASDGKTPREFSEQSLTGLVERAAQETAALYANQRQAAGAELQFAIYPWEGGGDIDVILDVSGGPGNYVARDIQGSGITFTAESLEELVSAAERYVPDRNRAMFRWERKVSEL